MRPCISCQEDHGTFVGGVRYAAVEKAMHKAEQKFVHIGELIEAASRRIAELLDVEAAFITPSCTSALQYAVNGIMAGLYPHRMYQLPDTSGLKNQIVIPRYQAYWTMGFLRATSARAVLTGYDDGQTNEELECGGYTDESLYGCTAEDLDSCIGEGTAALLVVPGHFHNNDLAVEEVIRITRRHNLPVIADAASQCYPPDYQWKVARCADFVCFGGKYIGGSDRSSSMPLPACLT